ncbi:MAG: dinitrogenase reductase [Planctomycetota bacterium]|jgi:NAD+--dinitrogen-reductase ADP-D-ribosyltransferase|nr:dinitrogenase reductase [Planctomycetota bacterium]
MTQELNTAPWYGSLAAATTRCGVPAVVLASVGFQDEPQALELDWVRLEHAGVLERLGTIDDPAERADLFHHYLVTTVWSQTSGHGVISARPDLDVATLVRGWGVDSNRTSGAILKAWAQSRFGLRPIFHRTELVDADAQERFAQEGHRGVVGPLPPQLDLLYTYTQDELARRYPGQHWLTLWRGTHDPERYELKSDGTSALVEFNTISSFTCNPEIAWEFGARVWRVDVPLAKIVLAPGTLPPQYLQGEQECLVLGGDYRVHVEIG